MRPVSRLLAAVLCTVPLASAGADTYTIMIENLIPGGPDTGQPLTPPLAVIHEAGYLPWAPGASATAGLELQAEDGDPTVLKGEADASAFVHSTVVGSGPFFDVDIFEVEGVPGDLISISTMLARTNDIITGISGMMLPVDEMEVMTRAWDAGTEENTGLIAHIPFYGNPGVGPDEKELIEEINLYVVIDDPDHGALTWEFPPVARITITRMMATPTEETTWGAIKSLF